MLRRRPGSCCSWRFPSYAVTAIGVSKMGLWAGFAYFCAVYYASNDGHRARNIGINEFLVGLGSFTGLFVCELVHPPHRLDRGHVRRLRRRAGRFSRGAMGRADAEQGPSACLLTAARSSPGLSSLSVGRPAIASI